MSCNIDSSAVVEANSLNTVKPVYKDHSREKAKTVIIDRYL